MVYYCPRQRGQILGSTKKQEQAVHAGSTSTASKKEGQDQVSGSISTSIKREDPVSGSTSLATKKEDQVVGSTSTVSKKEDENDKFLKEALEKGRKEWGRSKVMIVGEGRAGKTALANSILGRKFIQTDSTVGISEFTCNISHVGVHSNNLNDCWSDYADHKKSKEYETALAKLIFERKTGKPLHKSRDNEGSDDLLLYLLDDRNKSAYLKEETAPTVNNKDNNIPAKISCNNKDSAQEVLFCQNEAAKQGQNISFEKLRNVNASIPATSKQLVTETKLTRKEITDSLDQSLVMRYLGEASYVESKFILSIFDFGGQSVFNVIHPFFFTRCGVYVLVFNMESLASSAKPEEKESCLSLTYLSFWLNSIIIHTQHRKTEGKNTKVQIAPIFFVGTRKDAISQPSEHVQISTTLDQLFHTSTAWPFVVENVRAEGPNGAIDLFFYPVNNVKGKDDPSLRRLLQQIEDVIDNTNYVHLERPLTWFQILDGFKKQNVPYLLYSEIASLMIQQYDIPTDKVDYLLSFFHEMGILMWHHQDETLREIVVFDPVEYFVTPATIIICKHAPDRKDGIHHVLEIHRKVKKSHPKEFQEMRDHGLVSEVLLQALLTDYEIHYKYIKALMLKYGLLVALEHLQSDSGVDPWTQEEELEDTEEYVGPSLYLSPALLPERSTSLSSTFLTSQSTNSDHNFSLKPLSHSQFSFVFTASNELGKMMTISYDDCLTYGFLPNGLFERLLGKALTWALKTSNFINPSILYHRCYQNYAELAYGNQIFEISVDYHYHLISVTVTDGENPCAIHDRLVEQLVEIIQECYKSLKFTTILKYDHPTSDVVHETIHHAHTEQTYFLRLNQLRSLVENKASLNLSLFTSEERRKSVQPLPAKNAGIKYTLTFQEMKQLYEPWLVDSQSFTEYDLFISYRQGVYDSDFVSSLFDRLTLYSIDGTKRPIKVFLDTKKLVVGNHFQEEFIHSLMQSMIMIPIVSTEALKRMITLTEDVEDNVLIEWICGLECLRNNHQTNSAAKDTFKSRLVKITPIFFGSRITSLTSCEKSMSSSSRNINNLFEEKIIDQLPFNVIPTACLEKSKQLLQLGGITMSDGFRSWSVKMIVQEICKYLFLCAWNIHTTTTLTNHKLKSKREDSSKHITVYVAEKIVPIMNDSLLLYPKPNMTSSPPPLNEKEKDDKALEPFFWPLKSVASPTLLSPVSDSSTNQSGLVDGNSLTLNQLKEMIQKEFGLSSNNIQLVLKEALEKLSEEEQIDVNSFKNTKEKALRIVQLLGLL